LKPVDVFIIGAQKCGTTSLLRYLSEHSNILGHMQTEMTYFSVDSEYNKGYDRAWRRYYRSVNQSQSIVIAKNAHMYRNQEAIRRLKLHNPDCKIVFIIRNPVERAYSSYLMEKSSWGEEFSFDEIVDKYLGNESNWRNNIYFKLGIYHIYLEQIANYFKKNLIVLRLSELRDYPKETIRRIYLELRVNDQSLPNINKRYNVTKKVRSKWYAKQTAKILNEQNKIKKSIKILLPASTTNFMGNMLRFMNKSEKNYKPMSLHARKILTEFYRPHNHKLSLLLNDDLSNWNNKI
jgi:hypothetical protein